VVALIDTPSRTGLLGTRWTPSPDRSMMCSNPEFGRRHGAVVPVTLQTGDLVSAILATAERADLIAMPTKGRDGLLDVLREHN
jgi:hypothetical protein